MSTAVEWRRDVHAHPEVGFTELRTASRIAGRLSDLGWSLVTGPEAMVAERRLRLPSDDELAAAYERAVADGGDPRFLASMRGGHTAVVASLGEGHPHLAIRADIDALPITESTAHDHLPASRGFASSYVGQMHACGHDAHVGMAIELAERLTREPPPGRVTIVFQPAEEGGRGGRAVAATDLLDDVDLLVALHPEEGRNALLGAASATLALQGMTRLAGHETRVAVGRIVGGTSSNIVPDRAEMLLEVRADDGSVCDDLEQRARAMLEGAAAMHGLTVDVELVGQVTTAVATALMRRVQQHGGAATYAALGADLAGGHHTPTFDVDEAALARGVDLLEALARRR